MNLPDLGVGIIYFSGFEDIVASNSDLIQVIEIEPQTFWYRNRSELDPFVFDENKVDYLKGLKKQVLFHGVGFPVGGTIQPDKAHIPCLKRMISHLNPIWLSEHLSFNTIEVGHELCNTNFLLPPLQTNEGVAVASNSIQEYTRNFELPFAFETGVNYLSGYDFEMDDGLFVQQVARKSDCHILLDVHNLLANQKNGRQNVLDFIEQIDTQRVIQIHLAGGFYFKDYYLDAHSNVSSDEVLEIFEKVVVKLPNLKAITFEMLPEYLSFVSKEAVRMQLEKMNRIWDRRGRMLRKQSGDILLKMLPKPGHNKNSISPREWENTLGKLAIGQELEVQTTLSRQIQKDKGIEVINALIVKFRGSLLVSSLKLTCRYLMLKNGSRNFDLLLEQYWSRSLPKLFASDNGIAFAEYLLHEYKLPETNEDGLLIDLVRYEYSSLLTILDGRERIIDISFDPNKVVKTLANGELPNNDIKNNYRVTIVPETDRRGFKNVFHS